MLREKTRGSSGEMDDYEVEAYVQCVVEMVEVELCLECVREEWAADDGA